MTSEGQKPGFGFGQKPFDSVQFRHPSLGHIYPKEKPGPREKPGPESAQPALLGEPLSIREVARLLGCSAWTVRQRHIPGGLPHFRSGNMGKIIFFRDQVVAWILTRQQKGGTR